MDRFDDPRSRRKKLNDSNRGGARDIAPDLNDDIDGMKKKPKSPEELLKDLNDLEAKFTAEISAVDKESTQALLSLEEKEMLLNKKASLIMRFRKELLLEAKRYRGELNAFISSKKSEIDCAREMGYKKGKDELRPQLLDSKQANESLSKLLNKRAKIIRNLIISCFAEVGFFVLIILGIVWFA